MDAVAEAEAILGGRELSQGQLARLRALSRKYSQWLYERREPETVLRDSLRAEIRALVSEDPA
jgi:hypothetical protein